MSDLPHAQLDWNDQGQPLSRQFGDVYFSREDGLGETRHVFLAGNDLPARFAALPAGARLVIGETGFGTGLNFLCAWQLFDQLAPADACLHFVSVEKYPLTAADLQRALALWPELALWSGQLLEQYRAIHPGFQRLALDGGRVVLTLLIGDALQMLPQLDARIDVWFLDGFAPDKNPQMWTPPLFQELARLSAPGASLATFTSKGTVRRDLIEAGFAMRRAPGYGKKWEILCGRFEGHAPVAEKPWHARPPEPEARAALVIGAGLAGCATAASLAARGWQVTLLERHEAVAQEASGNPQGVLYLKLSAHGTALSQLVLAGFGHTRRQLQHLQQGHDWDACGVLQLAFDAPEAGRQAKLAEAFPADLLHSLTREQAEARVGVALPAGGLFYPDAGWVHPPALCRQLASHPRIRLLTHSEALELRRVDGRWQALDGERLLAEAPVAILAGAAEVRRFAAEHAGNLELLREISADLAERLDTDRLDPAQLEGRAAFRCTSPDYLPIVGPLADPAAFAETYAVLGKDARQVPDSPCPWRDGLYVNSGHGSRGLITAPLCGELLAAWLNDEPLPLPRAVAEACHPNRFLLRKLIRGQ